MRYREQLTRMIKAAGEQVIHMAPDLVGNTGGICDFEILLKFPQDSFPTIEVKREYVSDGAIRVMQA